MAQQKAILEVKDVRVSYGDTDAVKGVFFEVYGGEIFGLLGPNGAGKTSTLSVIEGLITPSTGTAQIEGFDVIQDTRAARANLGVQLQSTSFHQDLTVREILELFAALYGLDFDDAKAEAQLGEIQLTGAGDKRARELSGGQQQRLALAIAGLHQPALLLLDEPTSGLDPQSRRQLWERIEEVRDRGRAVLLTTHSMEEAYAVCDRIAIIDHGKVLVVGAPQELIDRYKDDPDVRAAARRSVITLEDVFIGLTGKAIRA